MAPCMRGKTFEAETLRPSDIPLGVYPNLGPPTQVNQAARSLWMSGGLRTVGGDSADAG